MLRRKRIPRIDLARNRTRKQNWTPLILGLVIGVSACALLVWFLQQDSIGELQPYLIGGAVTFLAILIFRAIFLGSPGKFARKRATGEDESHSTVNLFVALLTGVASFLGMLLLMRQNELMKQQNVIDQQQTALSEAARRSSYVMLMDNILNQVNEELKGADTTPYHPSRRLSTVTIGRIAALSQSLRPIRYLVEGDTLSRYLSPERGQLLLALVYARLDTIHTYRVIYENSDFSYADLEAAKLESAFLQKTDLRNANLANVDLFNANLSGARLDRANLGKANLWATNLTLAFLERANLVEAEFGWTNLTRTVLYQANLSKANFFGNNLREVADLRGVKLDSAIVSSHTFLDSLQVNFSGLLKYRVDTVNYAPEGSDKYYLILPKNK